MNEAKAAASFLQHHAPNEPRAAEGFKEAFARYRARAGIEHRAERPEIALLRDHVTVLCAKHAVTVLGETDHAGRFRVELRDRAAVLPRILGGVTYAAALRCIGAIALGSADQAQQWYWARTNAIPVIGWDQRAEMAMQKALRGTKR